MDRACWIFGTAMEADIEAAVANRKTDSAKRLAKMTKLNAWLGLNAYRQPGK